MRWLIASDLHGSAYYCGKLIEAYRSEKADRLLLLGDILYHGPRNELPEDYDPKAVAAMLNDMKYNILCVRGNCDSEVDQMVLEFPIMAEYAVLCEGSRMIFATHGHRFNAENLPPLRAGDVLLHGHTHVPACEKLELCLYCNPGSVSIPKDDSECSYIVLENGIMTWKNIDGKVYNTYDLQKEVL